MHLQSPKRSWTRASASGPVHPPQCMDTFSPLPTLLPSFVPPDVFVCNIHLLARLQHQAFSFIRTPTLNLSMYKEIKHTSNLYIRGEGRKKKIIQARGIHHKDYTLIPVHTAHCTDTMATSPAVPGRRSSLNKFGGEPLEICRTALTTSLHITARNLITHTNQ